MSLMDLSNSKCEQERRMASCNIDSNEPNYMECPLVIWVDTFRPSGSPKLKYSDLYNGAFLADVMLEIDPRPQYKNVVQTVRDTTMRMQNWDILLKNIKAYYTDVLQQLLIVKLPDYRLFCREPEKDASFNELKKALLLILGCAVQCEFKERFIKDIMDLEVNVKEKIAESIQQITDDTLSIIPTDCTDIDKLFGHLQHLIKERDNNVEMMCDLTQERDFYKAKCEGKTYLSTPSNSPDKQNDLIELAECKSQIRKLKQELDEKQEQLSDSRDECEEYKTKMTKLRKENVELLKDAGSAKVLRDELDILREKMIKVNNYEAEILKYKERLNEMEFYKIRVEELREDYAILLENKTILEEQLTSSHKRIETVVGLEKEIYRYKEQIEEMSTERDADRERIKSLVEENAQLQFQKKVSMNESSSLEQEMQAAKNKIAGVGGAISDQIKETTNSKILRLELENQQMMRKIEAMKESSLIDNASMKLKLEKENQRLLKEVVKVQQEKKEMVEKCFDFEEKTCELMREKEQLVSKLEDTKESAERQIRELEQQKSDLSQTMDVIRNRNEQTNDTKLKDLERENKKLHDSLTANNQKLTKLEFDNRKTYSRTQENLKKLTEVEIDKENLERENLELKRRLQAQELTHDKVNKLEQNLSDVQMENQGLQKKIQNFKNLLQEKEKIEQKNIDLTVENQKLQRVSDNFKHLSHKVPELENEVSLLKRELQQQQRVLETKKTQGDKLEKMELDLMTLDNENMKLQRQLEITTNRMQQLEKDNTDLEMELDKLQVSSKYSHNRLSELEKLNLELEKECMKCQKENTQLSKENKSNKVILETRQTALDDLNTKYSMLELSYKELNRTVEREKDSGFQSKESEKEQKKLIQNLQTEKQTVATLRRELFNEKVKKQELENELHMLRQDLEKVGIEWNQNETSQSSEDSRFKTLELFMEDTLNKSLSIKEDKIHALESRLEESKNRNLKLQEELHITRRECESLKQRMEEESLSKERERNVGSFRPESGRVSNSPFLKNSAYTSPDQNQTSHLVKLERTNASLQVENDNLKSQNNTLNEHIKKLESQNSQVQSSAQIERGSLQSQNAKLQVDNATFKAQCDSLKEQNTSLQGQLSVTEKDHKKLNQIYHDLQSAHGLLIQDHEKLRKNHNQSTSEFEALISEHGSLKSIHKTVKNENHDLQQQINNLLHVKDDDNKFRDWLNREREQLQLEKKSLRNDQMNYNKLRDEHDRLLKEYDNLRAVQSEMDKNHHGIVEENKQLKAEYNNMQQECTKCKERLKSIETEFKFLADKYDVLYEMYQKTLEDNEQLMNQVKLLISKNQELLGYVLNNKDQMAGQEKSYMEQLADLRRQKERLEEKIMEHYKNREKQKKNKSFGAMLLQKVRGGLKRSKSRPNLLEGSLDSSSLGSGSFADQDGEFSKKSDKRRYVRRRGSNSGFSDDSDSRSLLKQNRGLAKSTTALNASPTDSPILSHSELRGARSTEGLLSDTLLGDSVSCSTSAFTPLPGMGQPISDDEGGFKPNNLVASPPEFLTLEEFLAEGRDGKTSPRQKRKIELKAEDTESRSSENSDGSARRRRPAPLPPTENRSVPAVAVMSPPDHSMSRMSRLSTGGSSQDIRPESSAFTQVTSSSFHSNMQPNYTSTPLRPNNSYRSKPFEDMNCTLAVSLVTVPEDRRNNLGYEHINQPPSQKPKTDMSDSPHYKGGHETILNHDSRLSPDARLEMLTSTGGGSAFSPTSSVSSQSPHSSNYSSPGDQRSRLHDGDMSIRSAQGPLPGWRGQKGQSSSGQHPMKATHPGYPPPSHSPGLSNQQFDDRNTTTPPRKGNILVSRQGPRPYGPSKNVVRARPASAFGAPTKSSFQNEGTMNSSMNNSRPNRQDLNNSISSHSHSDTRASYDNSYNKGPTSAHTNGQVQKTSVKQRTSVNKMERPKSVPPTMFNQHGSSDSDQSNDYQQNHVGIKGTPPVPPPRKTKDILSGGRYSVLREPSSPTKPMASSNLNQGQWNNGSQSGSQVLIGQTPSSPQKIGPTPSKSSNNRPLPPKPLNSEDGEHKENSICIYTSGIEV
ncbi:girdin-like isoform X3 [Ruditapes philippinarum]|uniref:girdin-like isoform X3 n=1 Tax=Ruditapes philippinarum TaxID=129788 RepID=UPI00295B074B|nr:girdin-like isoform X3 [Ruditapes philippinarum]